MNLNFFIPRIDFSQLNWKDYVTIQFWFGSEYTLHNIDKTIFLIAVLVVALGILALILKFATKNKFLASTFAWFAKIFLTIGFLEMIWFGMRYLYVQTLASHFVALLIAVAGLIWIYNPIKYLITRYKVDMENAQREMSREKYLKK